MLVVHQGRYVRLYPLGMLLQHHVQSVQLHRIHPGVELYIFVQTQRYFTSYCRCYTARKPCYYHLFIIFAKKIMKNLTLIISVLIPLFSFLSTILMTYADRNKVRVDPLSGFNKAMSVLNTSGHNPSKAKSDEKMELHNKKMNRIWSWGIVFLIISFVLSIIFIVLQQI